MEPQVSVPDPDTVRIPSWVCNLESFRRWARSEDFPECGRFSFLHGKIWVDLSKEQLFTHNQVKTEFTVVLAGLVMLDSRGYFFSDRAFLSNLAADLSTEPDGLFVPWESLKTGRVRLVEGTEEGYEELEGSPDMALEIISSSSVRKYTDLLRELYWRAGITEYWLVDARRAPLRFDIFRHSAEGYVATPEENGWLRSVVFNRAFQLTQQTDPLGNPSYTLAVQP